MSINSNYPGYSPYDQYNQGNGNGFPPPPPMFQQGNSFNGVNFGNFQGQGFNGFESQNGIWGGGQQYGNQEQCYGQFGPGQFGQSDQGQVGFGQFGPGQLGSQGQFGQGGMQGMRHHHHHGSGQNALNGQSGVNGQSQSFAQNLFNQMDANGDGEVTQDEFNSFTPTNPDGTANTNMPQPTADQKTAMWNVLDPNATGQVGEQQFAQDLPQLRQILMSSQNSSNS